MLQRTDWTELDFALESWARSRGRRLQDEVNELLFLWVATIDYSLSTAAREAADPARTTVNAASSPRPWTSAIRAGLRRPPAPWLALRARLTRPHHGDVNDRAESLAEVCFEGEPRNIESEPSARASFQWALLGSAVGRPAGMIPTRSIDWMRHAVRLRGEDYWYQFFLANVLDGAGIYDERGALQHRGGSPARQPLGALQPGPTLSVEGEVA